MSDGSLKEASDNLNAQSELLRAAVSVLVKKSAPLAAAARAWVLVGRIFPTWSGVESLALLNHPGWQPPT